MSKTKLTPEQKRYEALFQAKLALPQQTKDWAAIAGVELYLAAKSFYDQICDMTTEEFSVGFDHRARKELARVLTLIDKQER